MKKVAEVADRIISVILGENTTLSEEFVRKIWRSHFDIR
jgi:hypothetical protein